MWIRLLNPKIRSEKDDAQLKKKRGPFYRRFDQTLTKTLETFRQKFHDKSSGEILEKKD